MQQEQKQAAEAAAELKAQLTASQVATGVVVVARMRERAVPVAPLIAFGWNPLARFALVLCPAQLRESQGVEKLRSLQQELSLQTRQNQLLQEEARRVEKTV